MSNKVNKKAGVKLATILNFVCVALMLVFFASQFLPFWSYTTIEGSDKTAEILGIATEDGEEVTREISLAEYVWLTEEHEDLFGNWKRMKDFEGNELNQNSIVVMPFVCTLLILFGCVFCVWKNTKTWTCLFPLISGVYAVCTYLTTPVLQTGESWIIHLIAAALLTAGAIPLAVLWVKRIVKWFTVKQ